jgi:RND family efflux transporter MFP subunit
MESSLKSMAFALLAMLAAPAPAADLPPMDCVIEPNTVVDLSSAVDGVVQKIEVDRGDLVEAGQVVARLDSGVEQAALDYARARAEASSELQAEQVNMNFAARRKGRLETLYQQKVLSSDQMDETATEAELRQIQVQQAQENKRLAELDMRQANEILKRHLIRSPIRGVVVQRYLSPGESVEDKPIMRLAEIDPLRAEVIIPVAYFGAVKAGQRAVLVPEAPKDKQYPAVVSVVDRVADAASGTYRARLSLPNPDYDLPSGLRCTVKFLAEGEQLDASVAVPAPRSLSRPFGAAAPGKRAIGKTGAPPTSSRAPTAGANAPRAPTTAPGPLTRPPMVAAVPKGPASRPKGRTRPGIGEVFEVPALAAALPACHMVGPLASAAQVDSLRERLAGYAARFDVRTERNGAAARQFWVDLQAPADPAAFLHYAEVIAAITPEMHASAVACGQQFASR